MHTIKVGDSKQITQATIKLKRLDFCFWVLFFGCRPIPTHLEPTKIQASDFWPSVVTFEF